MEADPTLPMTDTASDPSGATCLAGRYRLGAPLGQGGMSVVYRAIDLESGDEVAVKILHPRLTEESSRLRFAVEAVTMRFLFHPNIAAVLDMGVDEATGASFVVLELAPGGSLADRQRRLGAQPPELVARWGVEVLCALDAAHRRGIVHRDVKPANILLGDGDNALLGDFGVASTPDDELPTGRCVGTPIFMPPEQHANADRAGPEADLYALGASLYQLATGCSPRALYLASGVEAPWSRLPVALRRVLFRSTRFDPARRYPDARTMAQDLAESVPPATRVALPHLATWLAG